MVALNERRITMLVASRALESDRSLKKFVGRPLPDDGNEDDDDEGDDVSL